MAVATSTDVLVSIRFSLIHLNALALVSRTASETVIVGGKLRVGFRPLLYAITTHVAKNRSTARLSLVVDVTLTP